MEKGTKRLNFEVINQIAKGNNPTTCPICEGKMSAGSITCSECLHQRSSERRGIEERVNDSRKFFSVRNLIFSAEQKDRMIAHQNGNPSVGCTVCGKGLEGNVGLVCSECFALYGSHVVNKIHKELVFLKKNERKTVVVSPAQKHEEKKRLPKIVHWRVVEESFAIFLSGYEDAPDIVRDLGEKLMIKIAPQYEKEIFDSGEFSKDDLAALLDAFIVSVAMTKSAFPSIRSAMEKIRIVYPDLTFVNHELVSKKKIDPNIKDWHLNLAAREVCKENRWRIEKITALIEKEFPGEKYIEREKFLACEHCYESGRVIPKNDLEVVLKRMIAIRAQAYRVKKEAEHAKREADRWHKGALLHVALLAQEKGLDLEEFLSREIEYQGKVVPRDFMVEAMKVAGINPVKEATIAKKVGKVVFGISNRK